MQEVVREGSAPVKPPATGSEIAERACILRRPHPVLPLSFLDEVSKSVFKEWKLAGGDPILPEVSKDG